MLLSYVFKDVFHFSFWLLFYRRVIIRIIREEVVDVIVKK
jgi:hypothetical protein